MKTIHPHVFSYLNKRVFIERMNNYVKFNTEKSSFVHAAISWTEHKTAVNVNVGKCEQQFS